MEPSERQIKRIVLDRMARCNVCHHTFAPDDIRVLSRKPDLWMMVVTCAECPARNFVAAVLKDGDADEAQRVLRSLSESEGHGLPGLMPDASPSAPTLRQPAVSVDDVLDLHEFLRDFDGDLKRLLGT